MHAQLKHEMRQDESQVSDCPICLEPLAKGAEVILDCSHVYHVKCLKSYERLNKNKAVLACPMCRKAQYQKRAYHRGEAIRRRQAAVRIQACMRMSIVRAKYGALLLNFYQQGRGSTERARTFFADRVSSATDNLVRAVDAKADAVDALFAEMDRSLALSRTVFGNAEETNADVDERDTVGAAARRSQTPLAREQWPSSKAEWDAVYAKAEERGAMECPICMSKFDDEGESHRSRTLLSCSHVFHQRCIEAYENFHDEGPKSCPLCRTFYCRTIYTRVNTRRRC